MGPLGQSGIAKDAQEQPSQQARAPETKEEQEGRASRWSGPGGAWEQGAGVELRRALLVSRPALSLTGGLTGGDGQTIDVNQGTVYMASAIKWQSY